MPQFVIKLKKIHFGPFFVQTSAVQGFSEKNN